MATSIKNAIASCGNKSPFSTVKKAVRAAKKYDTKLFYYFCHSCNSYHLTHRSNFMGIPNKKIK